MRNVDAVTHGVERGGDEVSERRADFGQIHQRARVACALSSTALRLGHAPDRAFLVPRDSPRGCEAAVEQNCRGRRKRRGTSPQSRKNHLTPGRERRKASLASNAPAEALTAYRPPAGLGRRPILSESGFST